ncbi:MAG: lipoyl(octanoyl) transferase LipB [Candidatus Thermoplasmatota archaeon]|nr:lipoyl(octanoyl) transferase LipB [Candidatus Thermoplasmatota archaeon]MCL5800899.1 lipoyl(octanoyl) transferase LipB [Candidatus Thermoplasmatota archaeon]
MIPSGIVTDYQQLDYRTFLIYQEMLISGRQEGKIGDSILVLFHDHVYTAGIRYRENDLLDKSVDLVRLNRGGGITYHGPGQINIYPVVNIQEKNFTLRKYMEILQSSVSGSLANYGIPAENLLGDHLGTWSGGRKLCSYGVSVQKGVTGHGLSLNVRTDMSYFDKINPCGFGSEVMGRAVDLSEHIPAERILASELARLIAEGLGIEKIVRVQSISALQTAFNELLSGTAP